jgi:hypothetical protein
MENIYGFIASLPARIIEVAESAGAWILNAIVQIYAVLAENPLRTVIVFGIMIVIVWRVEVAQKKVDRIIDEALEDE